VQAEQLEQQVLLVLPRPRLLALLPLEQQVLPVPQAPALLPQVPQLLQEQQVLLAPQNCRRQAQPQ